MAIISQSQLMSAINRENYRVLNEIYGEALVYQSGDKLSLKDIQTIISQNIVSPCYRVCLLNQDETVRYEIPLEDISLDSLNYTEQYNNGQRRTLELTLININQKYTPSVNTIWYGTKFSYDEGFNYQGRNYFFRKGIYIVDDFDYQYSNSKRDVKFSLKDKYCLYDGATGTSIDAIEIPVQTPIEEVLQAIQNISSTNGEAYDLKDVYMQGNFQEFITQQTIRVEAGTKISEIHQQLATQMSAEYYYNNLGYLCFFPIDETMNDIEKPVIWTYDGTEFDGLQFKGSGELVNVIKVVGNNISGKVYSAVSKNTNLDSSINIYYVRERVGQIIQDDNICSDDAAQERADYELRKNSFITFRQTINVPYNPILTVNNLIEIQNEELGLFHDKFLINSISHAGKDGTMALEITNIKALNSIGGIK